MKDQSFGQRPVSLELHPLIGRITLALALWSVAAMWLLFDHSYYGPPLFGVITFLVGMFLALPWILLHGRHESDQDPPRRFRDWARGEFDTASGPLRAWHAAIIILSVPVAVAVGLTVFGLLEHLTAIGILG
ncbi:MAG TPA: hypothetical protein VH835_05405 [Dongiaceae bacterium]|jgi:hypothetical protein